MSRRLPPNSYVHIPKGSLQSIEATRAFMYNKGICSFVKTIYDRQKDRDIYLIRKESYS